jgi:peptidoglycan/xylan/chitin deacetylase (PgdA/CDA1 family)
MECNTVKIYAITQLLDYLESNKFTTVTFLDLVFKTSVAKSKKKIILTFDDCPKNLFDFVIPELVKRKMVASFYIPTAHIGGYNVWDIQQGFEAVELMDENDLRQLDRLGMEVGSHAHYHLRLKEVAHNVIQKDLVLSKTLLEELLGKPIYSIAYPHGSVPKRYKRLLSSAGYSFGLSTFQPFQSKYALRRFEFDETVDAETLKVKLSVKYRLKRTLYDPLVNLKGRIDSVLRLNRRSTPVPSDGSLNYRDGSKSKEMDSSLSPYFIRNYQK